MIRSLLTGAIDYAGLFPPAALAMPAAVRKYAAYRAGADAWALGRFVVPASRLGEMASAAEANGPGASTGPWCISALVTGDGAADFVAIATFNEEYGSRGTGWSAVVDSVEGKGASADEIMALAAHLPGDTALFIEVPVERDPAPLLDAIARTGHAAKIRTGGVTAAQFPRPEQVARFVRDCARLDLPFKATAGLHHPLRAEYPLTYEPGSDRGTMFGFINVLLAAAAARAGAEERELVALLEERDPGALRVDAESVEWRGHRFTTADIASTRAGFALSFGSCSFEEPLSDLRALGLLLPAR